MPTYQKGDKKHYEFGYNQKATAKKHNLKKSIPAMITGGVIAFVMLFSKELGSMVYVYSVLIGLAFGFLIFGVMFWYDKERFKCPKCGAVWSAKLLDSDKLDRLKAQEEESYKYKNTYQCSECGHEFHVDINSATD